MTDIQSALVLGWNRRICRSLPELWTLHKNKVRISSPQRKGYILPPHTRPFYATKQILSDIKRGAGDLSILQTSSNIRQKSSANEREKGNTFMSGYYPNITKKLAAIWGGGKILLCTRCCYMIYRVLLPRVLNFSLTTTNKRQSQTTMEREAKREITHLALC